VVVDSAGSFSVKELLPVSFNLEGEK
jgi:hypothetical protein